MDSNLRPPELRTGCRGPFGSQRTFKFLSSVFCRYRGSRKNGRPHGRARRFRIEPLGSPESTARGYCILASWERTATHLPSRFTKTSIHTYLPLESFPPEVLFSVSLPWTTATLPNTFTFMGPKS
jgi:hypothetical protein